MGRRWGKPSIDDMLRENANNARRENASAASDPENAQRHRNAVQALLPIFEAEDIDWNVSEIIKHNSRVRQYVHSPVAGDAEHYKSMLVDIAHNVYDKDYKGLMRGAKACDSWDRVTTFVNLAAQYILGVPLTFLTGPAGGLATYGTSAAEDLIIEGIPKIAWTKWYVNKTGDDAAWGHFARWELASMFEPTGVGEAVIDFYMTLYIDRCRESYRDAVVQKFLWEADKSMRNSAHVVDATPADGPPKERPIVIDATVIEPPPYDKK